MDPAEPPRDDNGKTPAVPPDSSRPSCGSIMVPNGSLPRRNLADTGDPCTFSPRAGQPSPYHGQGNRAIPRYGLGDGNPLEPPPPYQAGTYWQLPQEIPNSPAAASFHIRRDSGYPAADDSGTDLDRTKEQASAPALNGSESTVSDADLSTRPKIDRGKGVEPVVMVRRQSGHLATPNRSPSFDSERSCQSIRRLGIETVIAAARESQADTTKRANLVFFSDVPDGNTIACDLMEPARYSEQALGIYHPHHGLHFGWVSNHKLYFPRTGFFFFTKPCHNGSIRVVQWNGYNNTLGPHAVRVQESEIAACAYARCPKPEMSDGAALDIADRAHAWTMMTCRITPEALSRITGQTVSDWKLGSKDVVRDAADQAYMLIGGNRLPANYQGRLLSFDFASFAQTIFDLVSAEHRDTTELLLGFIDSHQRLTTDDLVAEFQFLFVAGAVANNDTCMDLWFKMVVGIVLHSFSLVIERPLLIQELLVCLRHQLLHDEFESGSVLARNPEIGRGIRQAIVVYKMRLTDLCLSAKCQSVTHTAIARAFSEIEEFVGLKYGDDLRGHYVKSRSPNHKRSNSLADFARWPRSITTRGRAKSTTAAAAPGAPAVSSAGGEGEGEATETMVPVPVQYSTRRRSLFSWL